MSERIEFDWDNCPLDIQPESRFWTGNVVRLVDGSEQRRQPSAVVLPRLIEFDSSAQL